MNINYKIIALFLSFSIAKSSWGALPVLDYSNLSESIQQRILDVEHFIKDSATQLEQLNNLKNTYSLDLKNSIRHNIALWDNLQSVKNDTLKALNASKSIWQEYGSLNLYLASFEKYKTIGKCMQNRNCSYQDSYKLMNTTAINFASRAYENASLMQNKISNTIKSIESISNEAKGSESNASMFDALNKAQTLCNSSLADLNTQISSLVQIVGHSMASNAQKQMIKDDVSKEFLKDTKGNKKTPNITWSIRDDLRG